MKLLLLAGLRHHWRHRGRSLLCLLGIALGVALVLGMDLAIGSVRGAFQRSVDVLSGTATHRIVGGPSGVADDVYRTLRVTHGRSDVVPVVEADGVFVDSERGSFRLLGIDPYAEGALRSFHRSGDGLPIDRFLTEPGAASVSTALGAKLGDVLSIRVRGRISKLTVVGMFTPEDPALLDATARIVVVDIATAQEVTGAPGWLSRLDVVLVGPKSEAELSALLPVGVALEDASEQRRALDRMVAAFDLNLRFLSLLALVVAAFLIHNTMTFSVVERRALFGRFRAHGVLPKELIGAVMIESFVLASLGGALGLLLGRFLAEGLTVAVARTVNDLYFDVVVTDVTLDLMAIVRSFGLCLLIAVVAAFRPAQEAAATTPRSAMGRSELEELVKRRARRRAWIGPPLLVAGIAILALFPDGLIPCYVALLLIVLAFAAVVPLAVEGIARSLAPVLSAVLGFRGRLAVGGVIAGLSRTGVAVGALAIALAMALGVSLMVRSFRATVVTWLDQTLSADVYVSVVGTQSRMTTSDTLTPDVVEALRGVSGVRALTSNRTVDVDSDRGRLRLVAFQVADESQLGLTLIRDGGDAMEGFLAGTDALASEPLASRLGLSVGDMLNVRTDHGLVNLRVSGIFRDYASDRGYLALHRRRYEELFVDRAFSAVALRATKDVDPEELAERVREAVSDRQAVLVRTQRKLRNASMEVFDRTFAVTSVLHLLAVVVAFVGIVLALMAFQLERAGELGVLRARGLTNREVFGLGCAQTLVLGLAAGLLALPLGAGLAMVLIFEVNLRSFGWSLPMVMEPLPFVETLLLAVGAALLAGLPPAWALLGKTPAQAMRMEEGA